MDNVTTSHFNLVMLPTTSLTPYGFVATGGLTIPFFILFLAYYYSLWVGHGNLRMASIVGLMFGGMFLFTTGGLGIGLPAPIIPLAYGALCASIAGLVMSMFKNM
jgi:hypothetical protein